MAGNVTLPKGFVLDGQDEGIALPAGFQLDSAPALSTMSTLSTNAPEKKTAYTPPPAMREAPEWGRKYPNLYGVAGAARETLGPILEAGSMIGGGIAGAPAGPAGTVAGAGLGYAASKNFLDSVDVGLGNTEDPGLIAQSKKVPGQVAEGMSMEMGGQVIGKGIGAGLDYIGKKFIKPAVTQTIGATTGAGPGAAEEALKGGKAFTDAMRGKTTGDEIVDNVRGALQTLKDTRGQAYQESLSKITGEKSLDISPVLSKMQKLMKQYNVRMNADGTLDLSRVAMGKTGRADIQEIVETVSTWGKQKGDRTPIGLDTLKRQLDDFYSDSSQARQFVTALRGEVKNTIASNVPEYAKMTKGYEEATNMIKDIESGLMLRKNGMSGRVTADNTLRRLTSAMRENFEMRRELLDVLGKQSGEDLSAQVAGYSMSPVVPRGLVGRATGYGAGILTYVNPKMWPLLAASSPRVMGEFLSTYGKIGKNLGVFKEPAKYASGVMAGRELYRNPPSLVSEAEASDTILDRGKGIVGGRRDQIEAAMREPQNALSRAIDRVPQESGPAPMTPQEIAAYDTQTQRMKNQNALSMAAPKPKVSIPVEQFVKRTKDGEVLMYRTKKGVKPYREFEDDPNL